jgi:putative hydrolase of the HAD superfamily
LEANSGWKSSRLDSYSWDQHFGQQVPGDLLAKISALFWDVGGVLLSNAWDRGEREQAIAMFNLDPVEFQDRHELVVSSFERGKITLDEYLARTVFYRQRPFTREDFKAYMFSRSQPYPDTLALARELASSGRFLMGTINNESTELNMYRIERFGLREIFDLFVSSCFVGYRKPERDIYRLALEITQQKPEECCFIDDRDLNLESADAMGMHTIRMENAAELREELLKLGVSIS